MLVSPRFSGLTIYPQDYAKRENLLDWTFAYGDWRLKQVSARYKPRFDKLEGVNVDFEGVMKQQAHVMTPHGQTYVSRDFMEPLGRFFKRIYKIASDPEALKANKAEIEADFRKVLANA